MRMPASGGRRLGPWNTPAIVWPPGLRTQPPSPMGKSGNPAHRSVTPPRPSNLHGGQTGSSRIHWHQAIYALMHEDDLDIGPGCGCPAPASTARPGRQLQDGRERRLAGGSATHDRAPRPGGSISNPYRRPRSMPDRQPRRCRRGACSRRKGTIPVILVDANLLVYTHVGSFPQHETAREWLDG